MTSPASHRQVRATSVRPLRYRGMLESIRKLTRQMRALARREARDWLRAEFKELRERRAINRRADRGDRREKIRWRGLWKSRLSRWYLS